ncbi:MAG: 30S ribosomal protein S6 [Desulfovibrio sp.]|nr:30S ribosomal protein S6 [Desulfovibrio sp.]
MRQFETLLLFSPELSADNREGMLKNIVAIIEREGGKIEKIDQWGMRDLAYPVRKQMRGYYVLVVYEGPSALVAELERNLRITEGIFKFLTVRLDEDEDSDKKEEAA